MMMQPNSGSGTESEFLVGKEAGLESLRLALSTDNDPAISMALKQLLDDSQDERILVPRTPVLASLQTAPPPTRWEHEEDDDGTKEEEEEEDPSNDFANQMGQLIVTSQRCLFVQDHQQSTTICHDMSIGAECIQLHAQAADPISVYLQLDGDDDDSPPTEIAFVPAHCRSDVEKSDLCATIFDRFTEMIALHPISPHGNDDDDDEDGGGGILGMLDMMGRLAQPTNGSPKFGDDFVVAMPTHERIPKYAPLPDDSRFSDGDDDDDHDDEDGNDEGGATPEERAAMLERLDALLVVPPGLEIVEDQFADADEDEEEEDESDSKDVDPIQVPPTQSKKGAGQFDDADDEDDPLL